jgi:hypothetical protein
MLFEDYLEFGSRIIRKQNEVVHFTTIKSLNHHVKMAQKYVAFFSDLEKEFPEECVVLKHYDALKEQPPEDKYYVVLVCLMTVVYFVYSVLSFGLIFLIAVFKDMPKDEDEK